MPRFEPRLVDRFLVQVPRLEQSEENSLEQLRGSGASGLCIGVDTVADRSQSVEDIAERAERWAEAARGVGSEFGAVWIGPPPGHQRHAWITAPDAATRRAAVVDLITAVDIAGVLGAKTVRIDTSRETAPFGVEATRSLDVLSDAINAMQAYAIAQDLTIECVIRCSGGLFANPTAAISWIRDLDFEEQVGIEFDLSDTNSYELGAALWQDKLFTVHCDGLSEPPSTEMLWSMVLLEDAEWTGWRAIGVDSETPQSEWATTASAAGTTFLQVQDRAREVLAEDGVSEALDVLRGGADPEETLPTGRSIEALAAHRVTRTSPQSVQGEEAALALVASALQRFAK